MFALIIKYTAYDMHLYSIDGLAGSSFKWQKVELSIMRTSELATSWLVVRETEQLAD